MSTASWAPGRGRGRPPRSPDGYCPGHQDGPSPSPAHARPETPRPRFTTDTSCCTFHRKSPATQHPCCSTGCSVVVTRIWWQATPAVVCNYGKGPQTTEDQHPERLRVEPAVWSDQEAGVWHACHGPSLRTEQDFALRCETGPQAINNNEDSCCLGSWGVQGC